MNREIRTAQEYVKMLVTAEKDYVKLERRGETSGPMPKTELYQYLDTAASKMAGLRRIMECLIDSEPSMEQIHAYFSGSPLERASRRIDRLSHIYGIDPDSAKLASEMASNAMNMSAGYVLGYDSPSGIGQPIYDPDEVRRNWDIALNRMMGTMRDLLGMARKKELDLERQRADAYSAMLSEDTARRAETLRGIRRAEA